MTFKPESKPQGFTPNQANKVKRAAASVQPSAAPAPATSIAIPTAREGAIAISGTSAQAMNALQSAGLQNAAQYVARKTAERNAIVDKVSDAIAYLSDPDLLEGDIMSAAAAKVEARSGAWAYERCTAWDDLFALQPSSSRLISEGLG
jgi:hypothetical protein